MTAAAWTLEWRIALSRTRRLMWSVSVPLALLAPVAASGAGSAHRAAVYALFVVFFGLFGAAAPVVRDAERGWIRRLLLTGYGARPWLLERTAAHSLQDLLQLTPALAAVLWLEGTATEPSSCAAVAAGAAVPGRRGEPVPAGPGRLPGGRRSGGPLGRIGAGRGSLDDRDPGGSGGGRSPLDSVRVDGGPVDRRTAHGRRRQILT